MQEDDTEYGRQIGDKYKGDLSENVYIYWSCNTTAICTSRLLYWLEQLEMDEAAGISKVQMVLYCRSLVYVQLFYLEPFCECSVF
ncbi:hypothetical protein D3C80_1752630 [compost metagenome]